MKVRTTWIAAALALAPVTGAVAGDKMEHGQTTEHGKVEHGATTASGSSSTDTTGSSTTSTAPRSDTDRSGDRTARQSPPSMTDSDKQYDPQRQPPNAPAAEGSKTSTSPQGGPEKTPNLGGDQASDRK